MDMGWRMYMKIVILERNSVGLDISVEGFSQFGEVVTYPNTVTEEEVIERIEDGRCGWKQGSFNGKDPAGGKEYKADLRICDRL